MALREYDYENTPTVSIVKKTLMEAIKMDATDIHFDPTPDELIIKFRINGVLKEYTIAPENVKTNIITRIKILSGMNINDSLLPQTGTLNFEVDNMSHNMQVSSLPILDGEKIVVHISNYANNIKSLNDIGFAENNINKIKNLLKEPQGVILITGNTNSGKTTTTYSILKELDHKSNNIISIEDPVKMRIKGINQVQIAPEKGLTYHNVLKNVMLQDPNIIAINDLVDDETTRAALRASVSGRLVISTMHTKTAFQTIDTLLNMDIENYLLGSNLIGIISQRLVKKLCPNCRKSKHISPYEASVIKEILDKDVTELYYPNGCIECNDGYLDQIPISEVIEIDEELRNAISNNRKRELIREIINKNTDSIIRDGLNKVLEGQTSFEEIIRIMDLRVDFTNEDKKIKDIILGNGIPNEENENDQKIKKEEKEEKETNLEESSTSLDEKNDKNERNEKDEKDEKPFVKVEVDNQEVHEEKINITNLKVDEKELKNMLTKIEENASFSEEKKNEDSEKNPNAIITSINEEKENVSEENTETEEKVIQEKPEETKTEIDTNDIENESEKVIEDTQTINEENDSKTKTPEEITVEEKTNDEVINPDNTNNLSADSVLNEEINNVAQENNTSSTPSSPLNIESSPSIEQPESNSITDNENTINSENNINPSVQPINFDDDDDDDDFNYGDSYINNF